MGYIGFKKLAKKVGSKGLAAYIGRKKYGKEKFQEAAEKGKSLKNESPKKYMYGGKLPVYSGGGKIEYQGSMAQESYSSPAKERMHEKKEGMKMEAKEKKMSRMKAFLKKSKKKLKK